MKAAEDGGQRLPKRPVRWHRSAAFDILQFAILVGVLAWIIARGAQSMGYNWQWGKVPRLIFRVVDGELILGPLTKGLLVTLDITWIAMILTITIGTGVAILRQSQSIVGRALAWCYVELVRNTPILVQILIIYFIIGRIFAIPRFWAGVLCLALYEGAFAAEIIRGGVVSVRKGQWEASRSLGLSEFNTYRDIVIPQAIPLILPPLAGVLVNLVKHSAIVSVIAVFDLATQARTVVSDTFLAFEVWFTAAALYLIITLSISLVASRFEKRYNQSSRA